jgi:glycosyltransferase involved in cell wall biosynthesis
MRVRAVFFSVVPSPYQRDLFRALEARQDVDLRVFYLEAASPDSPWPKNQLEKYEAVLPGRWFTLGGARCHWNWSLPDLSGCDVVVLNTLMSSLTNQWLMRVALRDKRWIFWGEKLGAGGWLHRAFTAPLHHATAIAAVGSRAAQDYAKRFPGPRRFNIPYHCDLAPFLARPRRKRTDGHVVFLFCGQMIARKGVDVLLSAFAKLDAKARLLLVGREAELPALLAGQPPAVRERIEYAGFQAPDALPEWFARADVFVLPSRYDGWGVVVNQALGAGLPVICSDAVGAGADLVEEDRNGLTFRAGDVDALASQMRRMLEKPNLIDEWGDASRNAAHDYTPERGAERWADVLKEACVG